MRRVSLSTPGHVAEGEGRLNDEAPLSVSVNDAHGAEWAGACLARLSPQNRLESQTLFAQSWQSCTTTSLTR